VEVKDGGKFPTVIEGRVEEGRLVVSVHDVFNGSLVDEFRYAPRNVVA
jgi:hypothetical protein